MERIGSKTVYEGKVASVRIDRFRYGDGSEAREAVAEEATLELPAGKLDVPGEAPLDCARRELAEEVGLEASEWTELKRFYTSPGFAEEQVTVYLATGLRWVEHRPDPDERIEVAPWPLDDLDGAIAECDDAKSLIGMLVVRDILR